MIKMPDHSLIQTQIDAIEAEFKRLGWWSAEPLAAEAFENMGPFGQNTMSYSQWLQFVFVPRVRDAIRSLDFPGSSQVGIQAIREFDGLDEAGRLIELLCEFDSLFQG